MPSALETLVKILKLEQDTDYQDKAVIGGLRSFASHWVPDAHAQARKPEHHTLIDELAILLNEYGTLDVGEQRHEAIKYMLGRITGRVPPRGGVVPQAPAPEAQSSAQFSPPEAPPTQYEAPQATPDHPDSPDTSAGVSMAVGEAAAPGPREPREPELAPEVEVRATAPEVFTPRAQPDPFEADELPQSAGPEIPMPRAQAGYSAQSSQSARSSRPPRRRRIQRDSEREIELMRAVNGPVANVNGIGPKMAEKLEQLGVTTIEDLLYMLPRRYDDYTRLVQLNRLQPDQTLTVIGTVRNSAIVKGKRGLDVLKVTIDDGAGVMTVSFFGQPYLRSKLERGVQVVFSGKTELFLGKITMSNPEWELLEREALHTRTIVPVYPLTKGLSAHNLRRFTRSALDQWANQLPDFVPESVLDRTDLPDLGWSLQQVHYPTSMEALDAARRRLTFDELLVLQLGVQRNRREWQSVPAESIPVTDEWLNAVTAALPYALTGAQARAVEAIRQDLARTIPMNRLLQGDVGSGKTVVAVMGMVMAVANGFQAAIMAPTGILAEQHYQGVTRLVRGLPGGEAINIRLLTGATPAQERAEILWGLGEGSIHIVVGTHALLEEDVNFFRLGLAIIDEQHRFGVEQRGKLRGKGHNPHVLVMTATPIPRTLALTLYADLDLTVLDEMPPGRTPIDTRILLAKERERAYSFIKMQLDKGRQAFVVYPLVEASESETLAQVGSAVEEFERLPQEVFPGYKLGLLHGRLSGAEKDAVMAAFSAGEMDILVSTSVVEVGIDVPNASVMLIEGANRFGLAQLHQFRGRVGRGEHPSYCLLIPDDGNNDNARLKALESTTDGFKLAEIDWDLRGAGDLLGTRQSGGVARLADYLGESMNPRLVEDAQFEARTLYEEDPDLTLPEHAALRERLRERFGDSAYADVS